MQAQREKRFVIRNAEDEFLCYSYEKQAYVWRAEDEFEDNCRPILTLNYRTGMNCIRESYRPKHLIPRDMVGMEYPDMSTARPCNDHQYD